MSDHGPRRQGFTLVELLIAAAILGVLLTVLSVLFTSSARAYRTTADVSDLQQRAELVRTLLTYELGLAGYRGVGSGYASLTPPSTPLTLSLAADGSIAEVGAVYLEDRYSGTPAFRSVAYSVGPVTGVAGGALVRTEGGVASPALEGVQALRAVRFLLRDGSTPVDITTGTAAAPAGAVAIEFLVTLAGDYESVFAIGFYNLDLTDGGQFTVSQAGP